MTTPNWQHHSKKEQKRKLKPVALRQARARRKSLKKKLQMQGAMPQVKPAICSWIAYR